MVFGLPVAAAVLAVIRSSRLGRVAAALMVVGALTMMPGKAHADVGSTLVGRLWDSLVSTMEGRLQNSAPTTVKLLQEAEKAFLGQTEDLTTFAAVRDVYNAMRVVGLLLLGFCTVYSLGELTEAGMLGQSSSLMDWMKRFCVAAFMTMGGIHVYGFWIRLFNALLAAFRSHLDRAWTGHSDPSALYTALLPNLDLTNSILTIIFALVVLVVLFVLWFLIGGIRIAEIALSIILAPLVWPVYLVPALEDIPKTAFRGFLGLNALLLIVVGMVRMSVRMLAGGGVATTLWNFVPAIALMCMTVFLPAIVRRIVGQGQTGAGGLMTAVSVLAGLKGVSMAAAAGSAAVARPPVGPSIPPAQVAPAANPVAPLMGSGLVGAPSPAPRAGMEEMWVDLPSRLNSGPVSQRSPSLPRPVETRNLELNMKESEPGSGRFDIVEAIRSWQDGYDRGRSD